MRAQLGLPLEKKIVLFVGNLVDVKGLTYLIEAAAFLSKERKDLLFLIIGEGKRKERLQPDDPERSPSGGRSTARPEAS